MRAYTNNERPDESGEKVEWSRDEPEVTNAGFSFESLKNIANRELTRIEREHDSNELVAWFARYVLQDSFARRASKTPAGHQTTTSLARRLSR